MWAAINEIAIERGKTEINRGRMGISLTAPIRVCIIEYYREALRRGRKEKAPPKRGQVDSDATSHASATAAYRDG
jgi:hypothetical protein